MINPRRVVVTGVGIVSPIGNNQKEVKESLFFNRSGINFSKNYADLGFKFITCENYNFIPLKYDMSYPKLLTNNLIKKSDDIVDNSDSIKYISTNGFESLVKFFVRNIEIN